jgi:DNA-directed RNA polymerase
LGAAAVNLVAGDKPADVYSGIAARLALCVCDYISRGHISDGLKRKM